ncbi:uncharacterized protein LOC106068398 [Biomphalaria glabrata]|uniref:Uncharacterized protein LOC106068398 n=1 Tax=Biomphalaria glabrata TaxID=6526 RepID=A0A9W2YFA8_BIOGL|nr:uncharacterized protein LOC106068398 [Biomphalaria glabrata]XP_055861418.1 uncharacterized protein LOC106068398 [Biomphalaria glabrata]XP_055861419.1 uncharacterized protein LOC106068398 [Biomphalaria glabrata]XP_055861420.1 uncharacterized protein LOC106068398 [Biomphalaria glabrata]XP_055861421.1 uncharacterized protein LOC106068398 [Biomphalaria glabrata]
MSEEDEIPLEIELQSLEAIYVNELTYSRKDDGTVDTIEVLIHPATGHDATKQYVCMTLVFAPGPNYPDEVPDIQIRNPRGLGEEEVASLVEAMMLKGEEVKGEVMLYTFVEMAKDSLTEGNIPRCPCVVCLEHFHEKDSFHRTTCYHYFHSGCLYKYVQHTRAQLEEEKKEVMERRHLDVASSEQRNIVCPLCRTELDESLLSVSWSSEGEEDDKDNAFVIPPEMREQQRKMAEIYERQKAKGGIIDPELEKKKFLVNAEDRFFFLSEPLRTSHNTAEVKVKKNSVEEGRKKNKNTAGTRHVGKQRHGHQRGQDTKHGAHARPEARRNHISVNDHIHKPDLHTDKNVEGNPRHSAQASESRLNKKEEANGDKDCEKSDSGVGESQSDLDKQPDQNVASSDSSDTTLAKESMAKLNIGSEGAHNLGNPEAQSRKINMSDFPPDRACSQEIKFIKWDTVPGSSSSEHRSPKKSGHLGSLMSSGNEYHQGKSGSHDGHRHSSHGARGHQGQSRKFSSRHFDSHHQHYGHQYNHHHHHHENWRHQERQTSEQRQRLVERTQGLADNMRDGDDGNPGLEQKGDKSLDSEAQDDGTADRKNLHINKKWRLLNFQSSASGINYNNVLDNDKYFHIIDDDEGINSLTGEKMNNKENVYILHQIQSNTLLMDDIDECYVGYGAPKEEDEWENEVDPYASERSRIRRTKLEDYDKFRKDDIKFYEGKLDERVSNETIIHEEERRILKERARQEEENCSGSESKEADLKDLKKVLCGKEITFVQDYKVKSLQNEDNSVEKSIEMDDFEKETRNQGGGFGKGMSQRGDDCDLSRQTSNGGDDFISETSDDRSDSGREVTNVKDDFGMDKCSLVSDPLDKETVCQSQEISSGECWKDSHEQTNHATETVVKPSLFSSNITINNRLNNSVLSLPRLGVNKTQSVQMKENLPELSEVKTEGTESKRKQPKKVPPLLLPKKAKPGQASIATSSASRIMETNVCLSSADTVSLPGSRKCRAPLNLMKKSKNPGRKHLPQDIVDIMSEVNNFQTDVTQRASDLPPSVKNNPNYSFYTNPACSAPLTDLLSSAACLNSLNSQVLPSNSLPHTMFFPSAQSLNNDALVEAYLKALGSMPNLLQSSLNPLSEDSSFVLDRNGK